MTADCIQTLRFDEAHRWVQYSFDKSSTESCCRCSRCWMMASLKHTKSYDATFSVSSRHFSGLKTKRPLVLHHPSWWFMLWCLPQSRSTPCLISLSASGLHRFILLLFSFHSVFTLLSSVIASVSHLFCLNLFLPFVRLILVFYNLKYALRVNWTWLLILSYQQSCSPVAPQQTHQCLGNHPDLCFRGKMEIKLSHSHHYLK